MEIMFNNSLLNKTEIINTNLDEKCWNQYVLITSFILFFLSEILPFIKKKKKIFDNDVVDIDNEEPYNNDKQQNTIKSNLIHNSNGILHLLIKILSKILTKR